MFVEPLNLNKKMVLFYRRPKSNTAFFSSLVYKLFEISIPSPMCKTVKPQLFKIKLPKRNSQYMNLYEIPTKQNEIFEDNIYQ